MSNTSNNLVCSRAMFEFVGAKVIRRCFQYYLIGKKNLKRAELYTISYFNTKLDFDPRFQSAESFLIKISFKLINICLIYILIDFIFVYSNFL